MAKSTKPQGKQSISTKAMFSKAGKDALRAVKGGKEKASKVSKSSKHGKAKQVSAQRHALYEAFSDSIESSREHISKAAVTSYDAAFMGLSQRLMEINDQCATEELALAESFRSLHLPFKSEEIEFRSEDGKQTGVVVLSHRMKKVQKTVDAEERELIRQYEEWLEVEAEIDSLAAEYTIPPNQVGTNPTGDILFGDQAEMMEEIEAEKVSFRKLMEQAAKASIKEMKDSEEELRVKRKEMEDEFSAILQDEEY